MKLSVRDLNWITMLIFSELFVKTSINNLLAKEKIVKDKKTIREIKKLRSRLTEIKDFLVHNNDKLADQLDSVMSTEKQDAFSDMLIGLCVAIEKGCHNPASINRLLQKVGFITEKDIEKERESLTGKGM